MAEGVDYSFSRPGGGSLKNAGKQFALRYLWYNTASKGINGGEWNDLTGNGLAVGLLYEEDGRELLDGYANGQAIARKAEQYRVNNGLPALPIYFCVDFDASAAQQAAINDTLNGVASIIGRSRTGLYAGYYVVKRAFDAGVIAFAFQTYAWSGGAWDPRAQVQQYRNGQTINGGSVDFCRNIASNFGASGALAGGGSAGGGAAPSGNITSRPTKDLQAALIAKGIGLGPDGADGVYGPATTAGVAEFQKEQGITVDGVYGPVTDAHLFPTANVPAAPSKQSGNITSRSTKDLQTALAAKGIGIGASGVDGVYGPATTAAVAEFQKEQGITVDGVYGPVTDAHLFGVGLVPDGIYGPATCAAEQRALGVNADGKRGPVTIKAEQARTGAGQDGKDGPDTNRHLQDYLKSKGFDAGATDGVRGRQTITALQNALNANKF